MKLVVDRAGRLTCLYTDDLPLRRLGKCHSERASDVEPDADGNWRASMRGGKTVLGPFTTRAGALEAEALWLENNRIV